MPWFGRSTPKSSEPRPICVLTVGRSGSSLTTRALAHLGVYLGEDDEMLAPSEQNPRGFWERSDVHELNEDLLVILGGSWYAPPAPEPGWEHSEAVRPLLERARAIAAHLTERAPGRWGFKDPRTVFLLPLWELAAGPFDYVIAARESRFAIESVARTGLPEAETIKSARLWLDANSRALDVAARERGTLVMFEDWQENPRACANQLAAFLGTTEPAAARLAGIDLVVAEFEPSFVRSTAAEGLTEALNQRLNAADRVLRRAAALARDGEPIPERLARDFGDLARTPL